jgi:DNA-binding transcriptional LysR family regulator
MTEIPVTALTGECVLARANQGCDFVQTLDRLCAATGVKPRMRHTGSSDDHIEEMVRAGLGIAISASHRPIAADLAVRPFADPTATRRIMLAAVAGRQHGPALALFLKLMRARDWSGLSDAKPMAKPGGHRNHDPEALAATARHPHIKDGRPLE